VLEWEPGGIVLYYGYTNDGDVEIARYVMDSGETIPLTKSNGEITFLSFSPDGSKAVFAERIDGRWQISLADTNCPIINECNVKRLVNDSFTYPEARFSPDGSMLLVSSDRAGAGHTDLWLMDLNGNPIQQVTFETLDTYHGVWKP
jgi:Tol biopolymer transport system component